MAGFTSPLRRFVGTVLLIVISGSVGLLMAEGLIAFFYPQDRSTPYATVRVDEAAFGSIHGVPPHAVIKHNNPEFSVVYHTNRYGLRDQDRKFEKENGVYRIVVLGDSFAFGHGVEDEEVFTRLLENGLSQEGRPVEVINLGVAGTGLAVYEHLFERLGKRYEPDLLLVSWYYNDLDYDAMDPDALQPRGNKTHSGSAEKTSRVQHIRGFFRSLPGYAWLCENSHLWALLRRFLSARVISVAIQKRNDALGAKNEADLRRKLELRAVESFKRLEAAQCAKGGILAVTDVDDWLSRFGVVYDHLLKSKKDCVKLFPIRLTPGDRFPKDVHWTPQGHRTVAAALVKSIAPLLP